MHVRSIEAIAVDIPLSRNFGGSTYAVLRRSAVITRMRTDDGLVSEVYNGDNREHGPEIVRLIHEELAPIVQGARIFEGERIWERCFALTHASRDKKTLLERGRDDRGAVGARFRARARRRDDPPLSRRLTPSAAAAAARPTSPSNTRGRTAPPSIPRPRPRPRA